MHRLVEATVAAALTVAVAPLMTAAAAQAAPSCSCSGAGTVEVHDEPAATAPHDDGLVDDLGATGPSASSEPTGWAVVPPRPSAPLASPGITELGMAVAALAAAAYASSCSARTQRR